jgi:hypothetical protein
MTLIIVPAKIHEQTTLSVLGSLASSWRAESYCQVNKYTRWQGQNKDRGQHNEAIIN